MNRRSVRTSRRAFEFGITSASSKQEETYHSLDHPLLEENRQALRPSCNIDTGRSSLWNARELKEKYAATWSPYLTLQEPDQQAKTIEQAKQAPYAAIVCQGCPCDERRTQRLRRRRELRVPRSCTTLEGAGVTVEGITLTAPVHWTTSSSSTRAERSARRRGRRAASLAR